MVCEKIRGEQMPRVLAMANKKTSGLRHGYIVNFDEVLNTARETIIEAERLSGIKIKYAFASVGGVGLEAIISSGSVAISRADSEVTDFDINRAIESSENNLKKSQNKSILQAIPIEFKVDGKKVLGRVKGIRGEIIEVKTLFLTCVEQHLNDLINAIESSSVMIEDIIASPIAASFISLNGMQRMAGSALVDIGAETVSLVIFEENVPTSLKVFSIGSTDITNDIALGFKISIEEAEYLKLSSGQNSLFSKKRLDEIISARLSDIFELIQSHLKKLGKNSLLPAGVIVIGGGSNMNLMKPLAKEVLNLPADVPTLIVPMVNPKQPDSKPIKKEIESSWAVTYGLCMLGSDPEPDISLGKRFIRQTKKSIAQWLRQFLP